MNWTSPIIASFRTGIWIQPEFFDTRTSVSFRKDSYSATVMELTSKSHTTRDTSLQSDFRSALFPFLILLVISGILRWRKEGKAVVVTSSMKKTWKGNRDVFVVRSSGVDIRIESKDVLFVRSLGNYIEIHTNQGKIVTRECLYKFLSYVPDSASYLRVHRCTIVRKDKITAKSSNSIFVGDEELKVGNTYLPDVALIDLNG